MNILYATLCIIFFSLTVPFTRIAALEIAPEAIILIRLFGASLVCLIFVGMDKWVPSKAAWPRLLRASLGSVIGFSSFTAFAMKEVPSGHGAVGLAAMPIVTAGYAVFRDRLNPGMKFWLYALIGTTLSFSFFYFNSVSEIVSGDLLLILAVMSAAFGYVEGGRVSREYGGTRVMSWAIIATLPLAIPLGVYYFYQHPLDYHSLSTPTTLSLIYLALISQSLGMFLWFKVLAIGPMEKMALIQLLQPFFTLLASILFLSEEVKSSTWLIAILVAICVFGSNREKARVID